MARIAYRFALRRPFVDALRTCSLRPNFTWLRSRAEAFGVEGRIGDSASMQALALECGGCVMPLLPGKPVAIPSLL
jgi:hypothetical protein